jgi:CDP-glucose 4,6-dehydratase
MDSKEKLKKFWRNKKVFITGHTGFKGSWMSILLNMLGANIYGYSLKPNKKSLFNQANCKYFLEENFYGNINNFDNLKKKLKKTKPDILFHLAAQPLVSKSFNDPLETFQTNIIGTANLLNAIRDIPSLKSIVIITTDKVYKIKNTNQRYKEIDELGGKDPYSVSKVCAEHVTISFIESFYKNKNIRNKISTARSGNVIGGGDYSKNRLLPDIINSINSKKKIVIRNPNNIRPWQHVIEPTLGYLKLAELQYKKKRLHKGQNWNFGPNKKSFVKVIDILKIIKKKYKIKIKIKKNKDFFETKILKLDNKKAKKNLNWHPNWNLQKSIDSVMGWNDEFRKNKNAKKISEHQINNYFNKK